MDSEICAESLEILFSNVCLSLNIRCIDTFLEDIKDFPDQNKNLLIFRSLPFFISKGLDSTPRLLNLDQFMNVYIYLHNLMTFIPAVTQDDVYIIKYIIDKKLVYQTYKINEESKQKFLELLFKKLKVSQQKNRGFEIFDTPFKRAKHLLLESKNSKIIKNAAKYCEFYPELEQNLRHLECKDIEILYNQQHDAQIKKVFSHVSECTCDYAKKLLPILYERHKTILGLDFLYQLFLYSDSLFVMKFLGELFKNVMGNDLTFLLKRWNHNSEIKIFLLKKVYKKKQREIFIKANPQYFNRDYFYNREGFLFAYEYQFHKNIQYWIFSVKMKIEKDRKDAKHILELWFSPFGLGGVRSKMELVNFIESGKKRKFL